jgi:hypothetical protein
MTMTTIDVTTIEPLTHPEAMRLQAAELDRTLGRVDARERPPVRAGHVLPQATRRAARGRADGRAGPWPRRIDAARASAAGLLTTIVPF